MVSSDTKPLRESVVGKADLPHPFKDKFPRSSLVLVFHDHPAPINAYPFCLLSLSQVPNDLSSSSRLILLENYGNRANQHQIAQILWLHPAADSENFMSIYPLKLK